jgi:glycerol-3-phosphate acyltransferase PlsY
MCFAGGACVLSPLAAVFCASLTAAFAASGRGALGARAGIFMFPVAELATDPISHVAATGALMTFIGILFVARRRKPGRATAGAGPQPRG